MKLRVLSATDVRRALPMRQAIETMRRAFGQLSANQAEMPLRTRLETEQGTLLLMPAYLKQSRELGFKMLSVWGDNPNRGLPALMGLATVIDPDTGRSLALMNGEALTALRTGATGGLATDLLARPDASVVAVFGVGIQGRMQLEAVTEVRQVKEVRVLNRTPSRVEAFVAEVSSWPNAPSISVVDSRRDAVMGADVVITATNSRIPVFNGRHLSPGTHVTGVGSFTPHMQEVDEVTVQKAKIVVDSLQACLAEAGDLIIPLEKGVISKLDIHAELGQIVNGDRPGRETNDEITFFKSVGVAVQDVVAANEVLGAAEVQGLGTVVEL
ncbi:MAG: ornithine cyclodeaminase family protein [Anaerolineae bacterium]|nr:ornithine cyclodeaminase family protein [Anaerolineae bacterium]